MKLLLDQDVYAVTARHLVDLQHDVAPAADLGLARAPDREVLRTARHAGRILVTRDSDFGALVFASGQRGGVIFLRMTPRTVRAVHQELATVLRLYSATELAQSFVVVEPGRHRIRRLVG
jgi:predicted nuclease of predicted toxin-antitoxin system